MLASGNRDTTAGTTNVALQVSQGEFAMGRTIQAPSPGIDVEPAASGTLYSQQGPSGVIKLSLLTDLLATVPHAGVFQDLGRVTINNQYINPSSIIVADVVQKDNGSINPYAKNSIYKVDVESRSSGSCVVRVGMIPFVSDTAIYQSGNDIRIAYAVINAGR
jgi:hypothetical protein